MAMTPLLLEGPKAETELKATDDAPIIDLEASESASAEDAAPEQQSDFEP